MKEDDKLGLRMIEMQLALVSIRADTIEECARVVESHRGFGITVQGVAAAIRALKEKQ